MKEDFTFFKDLRVKLSLIFTFILFAIVANAQYCSVTSNASYGDNIDDFYTTGATQDISNLGSVSSSGGYGDFTATHEVIAELGSTISINVQTGGSYSEGFTIWVDWNGNGSFADVGDSVWSSPTSGTSLYSGTITVPATATLGSTRMRVMAGYNCVPSNPCANCSSYGETEDYKFTVLALPFIETFSGSGTPSGWTESGSNSWIYNTSAAYGAAAAGDHTGDNGNYAWIDGSSNNTASETSTLTSPLIDLNGLDAALKFYAFSNNTNSSGYNTLTVDFYDGVNWNNNVYSNQGSLGANWFEVVIDLTTYTIAGDVQFRFNVTGNSPASQFHNDILIDDVTVFELKPNDAGVTEIYADVIAGTQNVYAVIKNFGTDPLSSVAVNWSVNSVSQTVYNFSGSIASGAIDTFLLGSYTFSSGNSTITASTSNPNSLADGDATNDSYTLVQNFASVISLPFNDGFEVDLSSWLISGTSTPSQSTSFVKSGTYSANMISAGSSTGSLTAIFAAATDPKLSVSYYIEYYYYQDFTVEIQEAGSSTWTQLHSFNSSYGGSADDDIWIDVLELDLASYDTESGAFKIRLNGITTYSSNYYKIYVDDFEIYEPAQNDLAVNRILSPVNGFDMTSNTDVTIEVINKGLNAQSGYDVKFSDDNGVSYITENISASLAPGDTLIHTFATGADFSTPGLNSLITLVNNSGDQETSNDTLTSQPNNMSLPYFEGFETSTSYQMPDDWYAINTTPYGYLYAYSSSTYANTGTYSFRMYNSSSTTDDLIGIMPPVYSGVVNKTLEFYARTSSGTQNLYVGVLTDPTDPTTFTNVDTFTVSTTHTLCEMDFTKYTGTGKFIGFKHGMDGTYDYFYIDDITIDVLPDNDAGISQIYTIDKSGSQDIIVDMKNYGFLALNSVDFYYSVNGGTAVGPLSWTGNLDPNTTKSNVIIDTYNFAVTDTQIEIWTANPNGVADEETTNDTLSMAINITTDAGILAMDEASIQYGTSPVNVYIANFGSDDLSSADIEWSVNGSAQTTYNWTGSVTTGNPDGPINLGNYNFAAGTYDIKIWTSNPNSISDTDNSNDTLSKTFIFSVDAGISQIDPIGNPGTQNIDVYIENFSTIPITSATIYYQVNGGTAMSYNWTGNLAAGATDGPITVGTATFNYGSNTIYAYTDSPNGGADANSANDGVTNNFNITADIGLVGGDLRPYENCNRGNDTLWLDVVNFGTGPVSGPFNISYKIVGGSTVNESVPSSVTIQPGDTFTYQFNTILDLSVTGMDSVFQLEGWVSLTNDANTSNDSIAGNAESWYTPNAPIASNTSVSYGNSATLSAALDVNGDSLLWYDDANTFLGYGSSYTTQPLYDTTTYYVSSQVLLPGDPDADFIKDNGSSSTSNAPVNGYYDYSWSRMIYKPSDLGISSAGNISKLQFQLNNTVSGNTMYNQKIYIMHTNDNTISSSAYVDPVAAGATLVYDGTITYSGVSGDWQEIVLQNQFNYNGSDNILILFENHDGSWAYSYPLWRYYYTSNRTVYQRDDFTFPTGNGSIYGYLPNIKMTFTYPPEAHCESSMTPVIVNVTNIPSDAGISYIEQPGETGSQDVVVALKNFTSLQLTSANIDYKVNGNAGSQYNWTGSLGNADSAIVNIGSANFIYGSNTIKVWSSSPNGSTDPNNLNDTLEITFDIYSDLGVVAVNEPYSSCGLGTETVIVDIVNFGTDTVNAYSVSYHVVGEASPLTEAITTPIAPGDTNNFVFSTDVDLSVTADSNFIIKAYTTLGNDADNNNDTNFYNLLSAATPSAPLAINDTVNYGDGAALTATSNNSLFWFDSDMGGTEVARGDTFWTPALFDTTTYYVEARSGQADVKITEIVQYETAAGATSPYPSWLTGTSLDFDGLEISNLGVADADLSGYTIYLEGYVSGNWTFPAGSILPSGEVLIIDYKSSIASSDPSHNYYCINQGWNPQSSSAIGYYLTDDQGNIVDAVATNSHTFTAGSGVMASDWSGNIANSVNKAGVSRLTSDNNTASDWGIASVDFASQTMGSMNPGFNVQGLLCISTRTPVTAVVENFPALDAGILKINAPLSGPAKSATETINITIKNYGTVAIDTIPVAYQVDGGVINEDTLFMNLNPGDTANFSFATTYDFSTIASYQIMTYTSLQGDVTTNNDTVEELLIHSDYCISKATNTNDGDIGNITIKHPVSGNDLLNHGIALPVTNNPFANKQYTDNTNLAATILQAGQDYPVSVSQITSGNAFYGSTTKVYIDFDQSGTFDVPAELVFTGNATSGDPNTNLMAGTMSIPANATLGNTRMRVVLDESTNADPCGLYGWGETEDYVVNIVPQVWAEAGPNDTVCATHSVTLIGSGTGPTYSWNTGDNTTSATVTPTATTTKYYFTVTDTYGFSTTDSTEVYMRALPALTFPTLADICVDATAITLNTATPSGGTYSGTGVSAGTFDPSVAGVGTHTLKYVYTDMYGCTDSITQSITVNPLPVLTLSTLTDQCVDNAQFALNFATSPSGGTYFGTGVDGSGNFDPASAGSGMHYIKYEYTDANGCYNVDSVTQVVNALPVVTATASPDTVFWGTPSTLNVSASAAPANPNNPSAPSSYAYSWTPVDSLSATTESDKQSPTTKNLFGTTNFTVEVTDNGTSCVNTDIVKVVIKGGPLNATPISDIDTVCAGGTANLDAQAAGGSEVYTYSWTSAPAGFTSPSPTPSVNPTVSTKYYITIDDGFNTSTDSVTVNVFDLPTASTTTPSSTICLNDSALLSVDFTGEAPFTVYSYDGTSTNTSVGVAANPWQNYVMPTANTTYQIDSLIDNNGCFNTASVTMTVNVNDLPTLTASGSDTICYGDSINYQLDFTGAAPFTYIVTHNNGQNDTVNNVGTPSTGYYADAMSTVHRFIEVTDNNGCTTEGTPLDSVYSYVRTLPTVSATEDTVNHCKYDSSNVTISFTGPGPWTVEISDGTNSFTETVNASPWIPTIEDTTSIMYYITSVTDDNGCTNYGMLDSIYVNVYPLPVLSVSGLLSEYCEDASIETLTPSPMGGTLYGAGVSGTSFDPATANIGNNTLKYVYTDMNGCTDSIEVSTTVHALPVVSFTGLSSDYCVDASDVTLTPNQTGGTFSGTAITGTTFSPSTAGAGNYEIVYTYQDGNSCTNADTQYVDVHSLPTPTFTGLASDYCEDAATVTLTPTPTGGTFSGNGIAGLTFDAATATVGTHEIVYTYTDANTCVGYDTQTVVVNALPTITITGNNPDYCVDAAAATFTGAPTGGSFSGAGMSASTFTPSTAGVGTHYVVYDYTDANSCYNADSVMITVNALPTITFTPMPDVCLDAAAFTLNSATPTGGNYSGTGISSGSFDPVVAGAGTHYVVYDYTDANGCYNIDSTTQIVNALPVVSFTNLDAAYCSNVMGDTLAGTPAGGIFAGNGVTNNYFDPMTATIGSNAISYTYTDANSCTNTEIQYVEIYALPMYNLTSDTIVCETNVLMLDPMADVNFDYNWSTGDTTAVISVDTSLFVGTDNITYSITDTNLCTITDSVEVEFEVMADEIPMDTAGICGYGQVIDLQVAAGNYTYLWSSGATTSSITIDTSDIGASTYHTFYVSVSGEACVMNDSVTAIFYPAAQVDLGNDTSLCVNWTYDIDAGSGYTYDWHDGSTSQIFTFDADAAGLGYHTVSVTVTSVDGCVDDDEVMIRVEACPGMDDLSQDAISIYPNPTKGEFNLSINGIESEVLMEVMTVDGKLVYSESFKAVNNTIRTYDASTFAKGVYYVKLSTDTQNIVYKLVIQ